MKAPGIGDGLYRGNDNFLWLFKNGKFVPPLEQVTHAQFDYDTYDDYYGSDVIYYPNKKNPKYLIAPADDKIFVKDIYKKDEDEEVIESIETHDVTFEIEGIFVDGTQFETMEEAESHCDNNGLDYSEIKDSWEFEPACYKKIGDDIVFFPDYFLPKLSENLSIKYGSVESTDNFFTGEIINIRDADPPVDVYLNGHDEYNLTDRTKLGEPNFIGLEPINIRLTAGYKRSEHSNGGSGAMYFSQYNDEYPTAIKRGSQIIYRNKNGVFENTLSSVTATITSFTWSQYDIYTTSCGVSGSLENFDVAFVPSNYTDPSLYDPWFTGFAIRSILLNCGSLGNMTISDNFVSSGLPYGTELEMYGGNVVSWWKFIYSTTVDEEYFTRKCLKFNTVDNSIETSDVNLYRDPESEKLEVLGVKSLYPNIYIEDLAGFTGSSNDIPVPYRPFNSYRYVSEYFSFELFDILFKGDTPSGYWTPTYTDSEIKELEYFVITFNSVAFDSRNITDDPLELLKSLGFLDGGNFASLPYILDSLHSFNGGSVLVWAGTNDDTGVDYVKIWKEETTYELSDVYEYAVVGDFVVAASFNFDSVDSGVATFKIFNCSTNEITTIIDDTSETGEANCIYPEFVLDDDKYIYIIELYGTYGGIVIKKSDMSYKYVTPAWHEENNTGDMLGGYQGKIVARNGIITPNADGTGSFKPFATAGDDDIMNQYGGMYFDY